MDEQEFWEEVLEKWEDENKRFSRLLELVNPGEKTAHEKLVLRAWGKLEIEDEEGKIEVDAADILKVLYFLTDSTLRTLDIIFQNGKEEMLGHDIYELWENTLNVKEIIKIKKELLKEQLQNS
jgi:hypothetical protein